MCADNDITMSAAVFLMTLIVCLNSCIGADMMERGTRRWNISLLSRWSYERVILFLDSTSLSSPMIVRDVQQYFIDLGNIRDI